MLDAGLNKFRLPVMLRTFSLYSLNYILFYSNIFHFGEDMAFFLLYSLRSYKLHL